MQDARALLYKAYSGRAVILVIPDLTFWKKMSPKCRIILLFLLQQARSVKKIPSSSSHTSE